MFCGVMVGRCVFGGVEWWRLCWVMWVVVGRVLLRGWWSSRMWGGVRWGGIVGGKDVEGMVVGGRVWRGRRGRVGGGGVGC